MIKLLTFTTLYPNAAQPSHGVFVENRLAHLVATRQAETRVVAPVAFVPDLPNAYESSGARVRAVESMTLEEIFVANVEHSREEVGV